MDDEFLKKTVTMTRVLNAPIELVWLAWTDPKHIINWWNPRGSDTKIAKHEFKVGGAWRYVMTMKNGKEFIAEGKYIEIIHHKCIRSKADFRPMTQGVEIQALFQEEGENTVFTFHVIHPSEAYKIKQEKMGIQNGWGTVFDRLEILLSEIK